MKSLFTISAVLCLLVCLSHSQAHDQDIFSNDTLSWDASPVNFFSKRTTCSGTCAQCYGSGSVSCGTNLDCYNPTIGDSCCAAYSYSCPDGYYCAPNGLNQQCCANSLSTTACVNSINNGGGSSSGGLSTGAKAGIGIGAALIVFIIVFLAVWIFLRSRNRRRNVAAAAPPTGWQMPVLAGNNNPTGNNQPAYDGAMGNYSGAQAGYGNGHVDYKSQQVGGQQMGGQQMGGQQMGGQQMGGSGGPPIAGVYTPGNGPQKAGYNGLVPSHSELPQSPPTYGASPSGSYTYPASSEQNHTRAAEMYGGHPNQGY